MVANAAPVSMLVEPGPMLAVTAHACSRSFCLAYAAARVHHRLLVAAQHISQSWFGACLLGLELGLQQRLAHPCHVAVPEDAEAAREELAALAVAFDVLVGQEANVAWATVSRTVGSLCGDLNADDLETTSLSS